MGTFKFITAITILTVPQLYIIGLCTTVSRSPIGQTIRRGSKRNTSSLVHCKKKCPKLEHFQMFDKCYNFQCSNLGHFFCSVSKRIYFVGQSLVLRYMFFHYRNVLFHRMSGILCQRRRSRFYSKNPSNRRLIFSN